MTLSKYFFQYQLELIFYIELRKKNISYSKLCSLVLDISQHFVQPFDPAELCN